MPYRIPCLRGLVRLSLGLASALLLLGAGCQQEKKSSQTTQTTVPTAPAPSFDGDSARAQVERQVAFGPRVPGSPAHRRCGDYLVATLRARGATVVEQTGTVKGKRAPLPLRNIIARFYPERTERILLSAHWDTRVVADQEATEAGRRQPVPGANDGASGVAVLLELTRHLGPAGSATDPGIGVDIALWDVEDQGNTALADDFCLGADHWARQPHVGNYRARFGILLDMVGARGATFGQEEYSLQYAPDRVRQVWRTAHRLGYGNFFPYQQSGGVYDDHVPINQIAGIPTLDIIHRDLQSEGFFAHWHKATDDLTQIDPATLKAVGQTVLQVVYDEGAPLRRTQAPAAGQ